MEKVFELRGTNDIRVKKMINTCESNSLYCVYYLLLAEPETERGEAVYRRKRLIDYREKTLLFSASVL